MFFHPSDYKITKDRMKDRAPRHSTTKSFREKGFYYYFFYNNQMRVHLINLTIFSFPPTKNVMKSPVRYQAEAQIQLYLYVPDAPA